MDRSLVLTGALVLAAAAYTVVGMHDGLVARVVIGLDGLLLAGAAFALARREPG